MTVTDVDPKTYGEHKADRNPPSAFPKMIWVGAALFTMNVLIGVGILVTPSLETDPYGQEVVEAFDAASSKVSPFMQTVDTKRHKVKLAVKLRPVAFVPPQTEESFGYTEASLDIPRSTSSVDSQLDIPQQSRRYDELDIPVRTEHAVYHAPAGSDGSSNNSTTIN